MASAAVFATFSRDGIAAPGPSSGRFLLTSFVQRGRTDIRRNEVLEFRFSAPLRRGSVDERTLQVVELIPEGRRPVVGARIVQGNVVLLDPRRSQRNYDAAQLPDSTVTERDHEIGFSASARFEVQIRDGASKTVLRARDGRRISRRYLGAFSTNALYDDPVPGQPSFGAMGFKPPPASAFGLVEPDASIALTFSEPVLPESVRLGETVLVRRISDGSVVEGTIVPDPANKNLTTYLFAPTGGFGPDVAVSVAISTGVTDLAGNALQRPVGSLAFATKSAP
jgi:hypothetical protein